MGLWYVIETIEHRDDPNRGGIYKSDKCPKINLYKVPPSDVKLVWQERDGDIHYTFKMTDPENEGFWLAWGRQTGWYYNDVSLLTYFMRCVRVVGYLPMK